MKHRVPKQFLVMVVFSALIGVGGIVLLSTSKAADLSVDLGIVKVNLGDGKQGTTTPPATTTPTPAAGKVGDLNNDGKIDTVDVSKFLTGFTAKDKTLDLNKDNVVDNKDLDLLLANYQR